MTETSESLPEGSEFPPRGQVNWELLNQLAVQAAPARQQRVAATGHGGLRLAIEMFYEMRAVHHLLDLAGVPHGYSIDTRYIDARTLLAVRGHGEPP